MVLEPVEAASADAPRACTWCGASLAGKRRQAKFCGEKCRQRFHRERAPQGKVKQVRRLSRGRVSVIIHFEPGDAERALRLMPGEEVSMIGYLDAPQQAPLSVDLKPCRDR